jgi:hypothetical protein
MHTGKGSDKKKAYLEKIGQLGRVAIWLVDGPYVRKTLNENFVGYDGNHHLPFIPKYEFWIDSNSDPREWFFFIAHLLTVQAALASGASDDDATAAAIDREKEFRQKLQMIERKSHTDVSDEALLAQLRTKRYDAFPGSVTVWLVDGKVVRDHFLTDYNAGGHDRVYPFVPAHEIWLEDNLPPEELKFILLHELHERYLMGEGKDYAHGHAGATVVEDHYRDHPEGLDERIREEMTKNDTQKPQRTFMECLTETFSETLG